MLIGGFGTDSFVFNTALNANTDQILDFDPVGESILLDDSVFVGVATGQLAASAFVANATGTASDSLHRIIYQTDTGWLFFDADGSGTGAGIHFATVSASLALANTSFFVF